MQNGKCTFLQLIELKLMFSTSISDRHKFKPIYMPCLSSISKQVKQMSNMVYSTDLYKSFLEQDLNDFLEYGK